MPRIFTIIIFMASSISFGNDGHAPKEIRIYHTNSIGTVVTDKSSYVIQSDGRILHTDSIGTRDAGSKNQYKIIGDRTYKTDSIDSVKPDQ